MSKTKEKPAPKPEIETNADAGDPPPTYPGDNPIKPNPPKPPQQNITS